MPRRRQRIEGAHCYEFFVGSENFAAKTDDEPATFFLTHYLVRHFGTVVIKRLGLDRFPPLLDTHFGNYYQVVYLAHIENPALEAKAEQAAARLGLPR